MEEEEAKGEVARVVKAEVEVGHKILKVEEEVVTRIIEVEENVVEVGMGNKLLVVVLHLKHSHNKHLHKVLGVNHGNNNRLRNNNKLLRRVLGVNHNKLLHRVLGVNHDNNNRLHSNNNFLNNSSNIPDSNNVPHNNNSSSRNVLNNNNLLLVVVVVNHLPNLPPRQSQVQVAEMHSKSAKSLQKVALKVEG